MSSDPVSFTVRRPTPVSRAGSSGIDSDAEPTFKVPALPKHLTSNGNSRPSSPLSKSKSSLGTRKFVEPDSSDEEEENVDEIVTGFDSFGVQRCVSASATFCPGPQLKEGLLCNRLNEKKPEGPLVIPALANKDWREVARKRKAGDIFIPKGGAAKTGADGSVGGLGTRDAINSGPQLAGLVKTEKRMRMDVDDEEVKSEIVATTIETEVREETDDEKAMRALIASASGADAENELTIGAIPSALNEFTRPADEADAFRRDVVTRPDEATLDDYGRTPVEQFGEALLRGMGWKPGQAASRKRTGPVEPYLPAARPALLGIGAKEREALDDGSKTKKPTRPEKRYVPLIRKERDGASSEPERREREKERPRDYDRDCRDKDRKYDSDRESRTERDRKHEPYRERNARERGHDKRRDHDEHDRDRRKDRGYEHDREREKDRRRSDRGEKRKEKDRDERRR